MSEENEENLIIEPDIQAPPVEKPQSGGCGCQNKETNLDNESSSGKNKVLFIILAVIVLGTFFYYISKSKTKVAVEPA